MSPRLRIELDTRPLYRVGADLLVIPFGGEQPFERGPFAWVDWRLCGLLRRQLREAGWEKPGSAALAPSGGRLRAPWILAVSMGDAPGALSDAVGEAASLWLSRVLALAAPRVALALPEGRSPGRAAEQIVRVWGDGLERAGAALDVRMAVSADAARDARDGLANVAKAALPGIEIAPGSLPAPPGPTGARPGAVAAAPR